MFSKTHGASLLMYPLNEKQTQTHKLERVGKMGMEMIKPNKL